VGSEGGVAALDAFLGRQQRLLEPSKGIEAQRAAFKVRSESREISLLPAKPSAFV